MAVTISSGGIWIVGIVFLALYMTYRRILPKPIPDIPYNKNAAAKVFGDVPEMMGYVMRTRRIFQCWLTSLTTRLQSPIVQAFIKPGGLPWVVVTDPFESQDILLRRIKEFDRSEFFGELINGILPEQHIQFISTDPRFKNNRNLINHLMAPTFIREVSAPEVYMAASALMKLWKVKCTMAQGRPFSAHQDVTFAALDSIFASSFGLAEDGTNTIQRIQALNSFEPMVPDDVNEPVAFPEGHTPEVFSAVLTLANSVTDTQLSPAPVLTSWVIRKFPYMRKAKSIKDKYIRDKVEESVRLIEKDASIKPKSALHSVLLRERDVATKEGRQPDYRKGAIADEFFGFMTAGHDTSATTIAWGLKMLTDNPAAQSRLRNALRSAFRTAVQEKRDLTYAELRNSQVPYLDATVEEILRHSNTIAFVVRQAQQDTTVLGRHIPKGTNVFLMANGPGYLEPNMKLADEARSPGARQTAKSALTVAWSDDDIDMFLPERWLETDPDTGAEMFNIMAGPSLAFGLGLRGCFGRKLALQVLKIHFALIVWNFELLPIPEKLGGYEAVQKFAREPTQCYIRLKEIDL
ncbi:cytochrome P450 [Trichoderma citrinoviride]|uniref:Cytochrome P450 n=1 Tax=Trichoderma citrinoviride TaxID=58853 RepID=A0A2T4AYJ9_9HYPO|nr:cytochrome P450 [Trichoderma citrinoviride]PTB62146.1 cytochrome P450 [Trichoderma citrinoviride]